MTEIVEVGKPLEKGADIRDAIHIAVASVVADERLYPGQHIGIVGMSGEEYLVGTKGSHIGIVDPFLNRYVDAGETFFIFLYPYTITSLRHHWTHPAFEPAMKKTKVKAKKEPDNSLESPEHKAFLEIQKVAEHFDVTTSSLIEFADYWIKSEYEEYWVDGGKFEGMSLPLSFWKHYETYRGTKVPENKKRNFFSCAC